MFQRIFVPLDGSSHAESALPVAACLAHATAGSLTESACQRNKMRKDLLNRGPVRLPGISSVLGIHESTQYPFTEFNNKQCFLSSLLDRVPVLPLVLLWTNPSDGGEATLRTSTLQLVEGSVYSLSQYEVSPPPDHA
jgi:hypothetical protein